MKVSSLFIFLLSVTIAVSLYFFSKGSKKNLDDFDAKDFRVSKGDATLPQRNLSSSGAKKLTIVAAQPTSRGDIISILQNSSDREWSVQQDENQRARMLSGGAISYHGKTLEQASKDFLDKYGKALLGIDPSELMLNQFNDKGIIQSVVYDQLLDGVPVYQSRIALFFDTEMNLVHVNNNSSRPNLSSLNVKISKRSAAEIALAEWQKKYKDADLHSLTVEKILFAAQEYIFQSASALTRVYRFVAELPQPAYGDHECIVDAATGAIVWEKNLSRK